MSYKIITCNCYFDRYLTEINENPQLLNIDEENLKNFLCLRDKWSSKDAWHLENRYHFYDDRIFHPCHKCIFSANLEDIILSTVFWILTDAQ